MASIEKNPNWKDAVNLLKIRTYEINDLADNELRTAINALRASERYQDDKECMRYVLRAEKAANEAQTAMRWRMPNMDRWNWMCDFLQERNEQLKQYIQTMYLTHKQAIDNFKETDTDIKARCMIAYILLQCAASFPKRTVVKVGTAIRNTSGVDRLFMGINYGGVFNLWQRVTDIVCVSDVEDRKIDITKDKNAMMSRDVFLNKVTDDEMFKHAISK